MAAMQASVVVVAGAAPSAMSSSSVYSSSRSVTFSNSGVHGMAYVRARSVRPLSIRAEKDESVVDKLKNAVSGATENVKIPTTQDTVGAKTSGGGPTVPDPKSSTGGITEEARKAAEKTATFFDGVKEDVESKLKDGERELKSKTGDVVYGEKRNQQ